MLPTSITFIFFFLYYCCQALEQVRQGYQVLVFVHSRKGTVMTAQAIRELAMQNGTAALFRGDFQADDPQHSLDPAAAKEIKQKQVRSRGHEWAYVCWCNRWSRASG